MKTAPRWPAIVIGLGLLAGCSGDGGSPAQPSGPEYLPNTSPENLLANLITAWEAMDAGGYAELLYGGEQQAADGAFYAPYKFHVAAGSDETLPAFWVKSREVQSCERLLGGQAGSGVPGVKVVDLEISPIGAWGPMGGDAIGGDAIPTNARWCLCTVQALFTLKEAYGDGGIDSWLASGRGTFQCLPVTVAGSEEWRLWKWWDETDTRAAAIPGGAVEKSLSEVRGYFAPPPPDYLPNDSPQQLVENLALAMQGLDPEGYAALLYDGSALATDGERYAPFSFSFDQSVDASLPAAWSLPAELACQETLLGEEPGEGVSGVASLAIALTASDDWQAVAGGDVEGDPCPAETLWQRVDLDLALVLKAPVEDAVFGFTAQDAALLYCLPVQVAGGSEWRLWQWREVADGKRSAASPGLVKRSLGQIKALYGPQALDRFKYPSEEGQ